MTTKAEGSWRFREMLAGVKERTVDSLEQIAAMDQKVAPIRTMDDMMKTVREFTNRLIVIEADCDKLEQEHERVRVALVRLQEQMKDQFIEHMHGWEITAKLRRPVPDPGTEPREAE